MRAAALAGDPFREATADTEFHRLIMRQSGNATLERVWSTLEPFLRTYITIVSPGVDRRAVADRHMPIIEALRRGNPDLVEEAYRVHFEEAAAVARRGLAAPRRRQRCRRRAAAGRVCRPVAI